MKVLVIGSGGREHTLVWKLAQSPRVGKIYCAPGNPGIAELAQCVPLAVEDNAGLLAFAQREGIGLTVVGPEVPLANGIVDVFQAAGLKIFGPNQQAAQLESSKRFAKDIMKKYGIPTAAYEVFSDAAAARAYVLAQGAPLVVKADGLAAGKGVVVAMTEAEALAAIDSMLCDHAFGQAGAQVVIEEFLSGEEASLLAFADGKTVVPMVAAQDHKRVYDQDQGPNTGGMGAYAPAPVLTPALQAEVEETVLRPMIAAMQAEGHPYAGCLYAGLIITAKGPKVIEFNARFGDPETQVVLPLLQSDLLTVLEACIDGTLADCPVEWAEAAAVCIVMAAGGYPSAYEKGQVISGLEAAKEAGAFVFHAGTACQGDDYVTQGGRVLGVTAVDANIRAAVDKAYRGVAQISFDQMHYRKDIAARALARE